LASEAPKMKATLGLTGLTVNAMALIAPGAFLWLTYAEQCQYGAPVAGADIWFGIVAALLLCLATAISYAELSKLYPGAGSSYFFAEQAFASKTHAFKYARVVKFLTGWGSHLYYWVYPGAMVGFTAIFVGYMAGQIWPATFNSTIPSPLLMVIVCVVFALGVGYIAQRGANASTGVNLAVNVIQISALLIFSVIALAYSMHYRSEHPGQTKPFGWTFDPDSNVTQYDLALFAADKDGNVIKVKTDDKGEPVKDADGKYVEAAKNAEGEYTGGKYVQDDSGKPLKVDTFRLDAKGQPVVDERTGSNIPDLAGQQAKDASGQPLPAGYVAKDDAGKPGMITFDYSKPVSDPDKDHPEGMRNFFGSALDVVRPHNFNWIFIQAGIAILILVGFESVTSMGEEAKNAKRDIPRAVLLSLVIQGAICYLFEYFAACHFLNPGYTMPNAAASSAPIGDMMRLVGTWLFGSVQAGQWFMYAMAITVFLALIGTTLSCINTGARVTYAMGRDDEVPSHFGLLHGRNLTPHRAIWTLSILSAVIGILGVLFCMCGPAAAAANDATLDTLKGNVWYSFGTYKFAYAQYIPQSILAIALTSNFGTFLLYMLTNMTAIVAFREHQMFNGVKHMVIPIFGLLANLVCMLFYLIGPWLVPGMSKVEPYIALGVAALWGLYGWWYFTSSSKAKGKSILLTSPTSSGKEAAYTTN
jgi:basic amino acid/polyamine antiporter, APA family